MYDLRTGSFIKLLSSFIRIANSLKINYLSRVQIPLSPFIEFKFLFALWLASF